MPHYIDADTVVTIQVYNDMTEEYGTKRVTIADAIDEWSDEGCPPFADVPERNVGEWIITEHHSNYADWDDYTCPFCRKTFGRIYGARFCPSCGARLFDKDTNVPGKGESDANNNNQN